MELRTINTFLHIAELHSFSRAARELGYSQSAVSSQIAQLEAELGTPLFDRVGKTVRLTDAGLTFQDYARTLLATAQQAKAALQPAREVRGTLRIALADSVCSTFLPDLLLHYHARCPEVELVLRTATADEMLQWLSSNLYPRSAHFAAQSCAGVQRAGAHLHGGSAKPSAGPAGGSHAGGACEAGISAHRAGNELPRRSGSVHGRPSPGSEALH